MLVDSIDHALYTINLSTSPVRSRKDPLVHPPQTVVRITLITAKSMVFMVMLERADMVMGRSCSRVVLLGSRSRSLTRTV